MDPSFEKELDLACDLVRQASKVVLECYGGSVEVRWKGKNDPVTDADEASTRLILGMIGKTFPDDAVLIEEREDDPRRLKSARTWIVDPLDGTKEFIDRNGEFTVMVGFVAGGAPVVGAVAIPVSGALVAGMAGAGAFRVEGNARRAILPGRSPEPGDATLIVSRSHRSAAIDAVKEKLGITREIPCGSVGLKMIRVISGEADLYIHFGRGAKLWDTCAPDAIARAAGIRFSDACGKDIDYLAPQVTLERGIVVAAEDLHARVIAATSCLAP
jgi:3'(2'), 5'-bisphosphate nucleotidase